MFGQSLDSMVGQLTTVGSPSAVAAGQSLDWSNPMVGVLALILIIVILGSGGTAAKKAADSKKYKNEELDVKTEDDGTRIVTEKATGKELFRGGKVDYFSWKAKHVERELRGGGTATGGRK